MRVFLHCKVQNRWDQGVLQTRSFLDQDPLPLLLNMFVLFLSRPNQKQFASQELEVWRRADVLGGSVRQRE